MTIPFHICPNLLLLHFYSWTEKSALEFQTDFVEAGKTSDVFQYLKIKISEFKLFLHDNTKQDRTDSILRKNNISDILNKQPRLIELFNCLTLKTNFF